MGGNEGAWDTYSTSDSEVMGYRNQEREGQIGAGLIGVCVWEVEGVVVRGSAS